MAEKLQLHRKTCLSTAVAAAASLTILPSKLLRGAEVPSERFRFAQIGAGGKGFSDRQAMLNAGAEVVVLCDVDQNRGKKAFEIHSDKPVFQDYRRLLDKHEKGIDGVVVSTPDHTHACIALEAIKRGKHVYVQKPLARTFRECQVLFEASQKHKVVTQMGNQGHSGDGLKLWQQMLDQGVFGEIEEIHSWTNRPVWPQGMQSLPEAEIPPKELNWDLWLGPAKKRDFSNKYLPFSWRGWWDFGCGAMGDMAVHNMDPAFWLFKLGLPDTVKAKVSDKVDIAYPRSSVIELGFKQSPVTGKPIHISWYDGKERPSMPKGSHPELTPSSNGFMIVGSKMSAMGGSHADRPRPIAVSGKNYGDEVKELERFWRAEAKKLTKDNHYAQWVEAAKAGDTQATTSKFEYSVPFTQALLLGCIALRYPEQTLEWNHEQRKFSNQPDANQWLSFTNRSEFSLNI